MFGEFEMIDDEEEYEDSGKGNRFLGFMFGNVDNSGDLDVDYLDEVILCSLYCYFWIWGQHVWKIRIEMMHAYMSCSVAFCFFVFLFLLSVIRAIQFWRILVFSVQTAKTDRLFATFVFGCLVETISSDFAFCNCHFSENTNVWLLLDRIDFASKPQFD